MFRLAAPRFVITKPSVGTFGIFPVLYVTSSTAFKKSSCMVISLVIAFPLAMAKILYVPGFTVILSAVYCIFLPSPLTCLMFFSSCWSFRLLVVESNRYTVRSFEPVSVTPDDSALRVWFSLGISKNRARLPFESVWLSSEKAISASLMQLYCVAATINNSDISCVNLFILF